MSLPVVLSVNNITFNELHKYIDTYMVSYCYYYNSELVVGIFYYSCIRFITTCSEYPANDVEIDIILKLRIYIYSTYF